MSASASPRFCVDCRHHFLAPLAQSHDEWHKCARVGVVRESPVTGRCTTFALCHREREFGGECGPAGQLFEHRSLLRRLWARMSPA